MPMRQKYQSVRSTSLSDWIGSPTMGPTLLCHLRARSASIRALWEALLHLEVVSGSLANPDTLDYLIPDSLEQVFALIATLSSAPRAMKAATVRPPEYACGNNPYLAYYAAGEQALLVALVILRAEMPADKRREIDLGESRLAVRWLARSEIDTFCDVCTHRGVASRCRHAVAVGKRDGVGQ